MFSLTGDQDAHGVIIGEQIETGKVICKEWVSTDFVEQLRNNNILLAGPSGAGKTSSFILPNIMSHIQSGHSLIIFDPKGDIYSDMAPIAMSEGYRKIRILNLRTDEMNKSDGWDVLKPLREADNPETMADDFTNCILKNLGGDRQDFWNFSNRNLLSLALLYVAVARHFIPADGVLRRDENGNPLRPGDKERTFKEVIAYIENPAALQTNVSAAINMRDGDDSLLFGRYNTWVKNKEKDQIASGLSIALSIFRNKTVSEILSKDDITIDMLAEEKSIIFIIPPLMSDAFQPITALFFMSAMDELVKIASKRPSNTLDRMVYLILEELPSIGQIPKLREALNIVRSFNIAMLLCVQQVADIKGIYADRSNNEAFKAIFDNCLLQICMGGRYHQGSEMSNASYFSDISGMQTIYEKTSMEERNKLLPEKIQEVTVLDKREMARSSGQAVYLPGDIMSLKGNEMLVFPAMHNAFMCHRYFWKRHPLSNIRVRDKRTGKELVLKTCDHVPHFISGTDDLFDPNRYEIYDKRLADSLSGMYQETSGVSWDKFMD